MKCFTVKKIGFSFGNEETFILNNTVYGSFNGVVAAMKADCDVESRRPVSSNQKVRIDEKRETAYIGDYKTHAGYTVEEHEFVSENLG